MESVRERRPHAVYTLVALFGCLIGPYSAQAAPQPKPICKTIPVAATPGLIALDPTTDTVYVRGRDMPDRNGEPQKDRTLTALNGHTRQVLHVWPDKPLINATGLPALNFFRTGNGLLAALVPTALVGIGLDYVGIDRSVNRLYRLNQTGSLTLDFLNLATGRVVAGQSLANDGFSDVVVDPRSRRVFVPFPDGNGISITLYVYDAVSGRLLATALLPLDTESALTVDDPADRVIISSGRTVQIYTLDTLHLVRTIAGQHYIGPLPPEILPTLDLNRNYDAEPVAVDPTLGRAIIINPANMDDPNALTLDGMALIIDDRTGKLLYTVPIGVSPTAVQVDAQLHRAYITNSASHDVTVLDMRTGKQVALVNVGSFPVSLTLDTASGEAFVADSYGNTVTMFPLTTTQGAKASYPPLTPMISATPTWPICP